MRKLIVPVVALIGALASAGAFAQGPSAPQGGTPGMQPMPGMQQMPTQRQGGMMMDCPMMQRMALLDTRLRQLEERAGISAPPAPSSTPR